MEFLEKILAEKFLPYAHKEWAPLVVFFVASIAGGFGLISVEIKIFPVTPWHLILAAAIIGLICGITTYLVFKLPNFEKNEIGLLLAIKTETEAERLRVQNDFAENIEKALQASGSKLKFKVVILPPRISNHIKSPKDAIAITNKCKARFAIYGDVRTRTFKDKDYYVLRVISLVTHINVGSNIQELLRSEMNSLLPGETRIDCKDDLEGFELTSKQFALGSKYVIAIALYISGAKKEATDLLQSLYSSIRLLKKQTELPSTEQLLTLVPKRLSELLHEQCHDLFWHWRNSHDNHHLIYIEELIERVPKEHSSMPSLLTLRAVCTFVLLRDIPKSENLIREVGKSEPNQPHWKYSLAFLAAYQGKLDNAYKLYRNAFNDDESNELPVEIEEFIAWIVEVEPDKYQLHYCLGLINFKKKKDFARANADFSLFIENADAKLYEKQIKAANKYISEMANYYEKEAA